MLLCNCGFSKNRYHGDKDKNISILKLILVLIIQIQIINNNWSYFLLLKHGSLL